MSEKDFSDEWNEDIDLYDEDSETSLLEDDDDLDLPDEEDLPDEDDLYLNEDSYEESRYDSEDEDSENIDENPVDDLDEGSISDDDFSEDDLLELLKDSDEDEILEHLERSSFGDEDLDEIDPDEDEELYELEDLESAENPEEEDFSWRDLDDEEEEDKYEELDSPSDDDSYEDEFKNEPSASDSVDDWSDLGGDDKEDEDFDDDEEISLDEDDPFNELDDEEPSDDDNKKSKGKSNSSNVSLFSNVKKLYESFADLILKILLFIVELPTKLPVVGKFIKPLSNILGNLFKALRMFLPLILIVILVFVFWGVKPGDNKSSVELPDNGEVKITNIQKNGNKVQFTAENSGDVVVYGIPTAQVKVRTMNPVTWFSPEDIGKCSGKEFDLKIDQKKDVSLTCSFNVPSGSSIDIDVD